MKASELREITTKSKVDTEQYEEVLKYAREKAEQGLYYVWVNKNLKPEVVQALEDDGFTVENHANTRDGELSWVSWE